ncbi:hypothetical protein H6G33_28385 [Calothrix sp. FACHB-1219]|nr:hypothetical protein [Calothrix sp. FACHB-1219]
MIDIILPPSGESDASLNSVEHTEGLPILLSLLDCLAIAISNQAANVSGNYLSNSENISPAVGCYYTT